MSEQPDRYVAIWREADKKPLDGVQYHRENVGTVGLGITADFLRDLYYSSPWPKTGEGVGFLAGGKALDGSLSILVVTFTNAGPQARYPGATDKLGITVLEAQFFFAQLAFFEQQQGFAAMAIAQQQEQRRMQDLLRGVSLT